MLPEQRKDQFRSDSWTAPWRVSAMERDELLRWFLRADLTSDESVARLRSLTGRDFGPGVSVWTLKDGQVWFWAPANQHAELKRRAALSAKKGSRVVIGDPEMIPPGQEDRYSPCVLQEPVSREVFVAFYDRVQGSLHKAERWLYAWHKNEASAQVQTGVQLFGFLDDVRVDAATTSDGFRMERPLRPELRSVSLVGELALAMFQRMIKAREVVLCPACGEIEAFPDVRHREICSKPECRAWYRAKWMRQKYATEKAATRRRGRGKTSAKVKALSETRKGARKAAKR